MFSVLTFLLTLSMLTLAAYYITLHPVSGVYAEKTANVFGDAASDYRSLLSVDVEILDGSVVFTDVFPYVNGTQYVNDYEEFIEGEYAGVLNTDIELDAGQPHMVVEPAGIVYGYSTYNKPSIRIYNASGGADGVDGYDVYVSADKPLLNVTEDESGTGLTVRLNGSFSNGTYYGTHTVAPDTQSAFTFTLDDSKLIVEVGANVIDGVGRNGSLVIRRTGDVISEVTVAVLFDDTAGYGVRTDMYLNVSDVVSKGDWLWLTPPVTPGQQPTTPPTSTSSTTSTATSTPTSTASSTSTSTSTSTTPETCGAHCTGLGYGGGTCRQNPNQCSNNGETHETGGDTYCTAGPQADTCCCAPGSTSSSTASASTASSAPSTSPSTSTTTTTSCEGYCTGQGYGGGTCRQNPNQCSNNGETHETGGDTYCTGGPSQDTCCCV